MKSIRPSNLSSAPKRLIKISLFKRINTLDQAIHRIQTLLNRMRSSAMPACRWYKEIKKYRVKTKSYSTNIEWWAKEAPSCLRVELISSIWPVTWINMSTLTIRTVWHRLSTYTWLLTTPSNSGPQRKRQRVPASKPAEVHSILSLKLKNGNNLKVTSASITTNSSKINLEKVLREETSICLWRTITSNKKC